MNDREKIILTLKENGLRVTQSRLAIVDILINNQDNLLTPEEIFQLIQRESMINCDLVSVYRTLTTLEELKLLTRSSFHGEANRYKLIDNDNQSHKHEHFFKCMSCQRIEPFQECLVARKEKELAKKGYKNLHHHLEITGICPSCA